mgnify:CR=1 FL=1
MRYYNFQRLFIFVALINNTTTTTWKDKQNLINRESLICLYVQSLFSLSFFHLNISKMFRKCWSIFNVFFFKIAKKKHITFLIIKMHLWNFMSDHLRNFNHEISKMKFQPWNFQNEISEIYMMKFLKFLKFQPWNFRHEMSEISDISCLQFHGWNFWDDQSWNFRNFMSDHLRNFTHEISCLIIWSWLKFQKFHQRNLWNFVLEI